jgi:MraZ protein
LSFTGEFRHAVDAKGRLIVPARLRDELDEGKVVLASWLDGCVAMWSDRRWNERVAEPLIAARNSDPRKRTVARAIAASAHTDVVDAQGRITVPENLRESAGITRDVVVIGALDHAEIWSPDRWEAQRAKVASGGLEELAQELDF